jgi:hypothetical protein
MTGAAPAPRLQALLGDDAPAAPLIELSSALARQLGRPLEVVYVESAAALLAATLPGTCVLAQGAAQWRPLGADEVERAFRSRAARLQALLDRLAGQPALEVCALRVVRGALQRAAFELQPRSDLMLVAPTAPLPVATHAPSARARRMVVVLADDTPVGRQARAVASDVARLLEGELDEPPGGTAAAALGALHCALLVLPRTRMVPGLLERLWQPVLLVG